MKKDTSTFSIKMDSKLVDDVRNACWGIPGMTITKFTEWALTQGIEYMVRKYRNGESFPQRESEVRTGRPIKSRADG